MANVSSTPNPSDVVLTFLESIGRRSDAEFYLKLFKDLPPESFALLCPDRDVVTEALDSLVQQLRFLAQLGLYAPAVLGLLEPSPSADAERLDSALTFSGLRSQVLRMESERLAPNVCQALAQGQVPILKFNHPGASEADRFRALAALSQQLGTRKLVLLHARGGLGPRGPVSIRLQPGHVTLPTHESGISVINLRSDTQLLLGSPHLDAGEKGLLERIRDLLDANPSTPQSVSITSPLNVLRELFTVRGAGTFIKRGSPISRHDSYNTIDRQQLEELLIDTFGKSIKPSFFERPSLAIYLEQAYRGAAIVEPAQLPDSAGGAAFLTKFAVTRLAQGEGIGRDLWTAVERDHPRIYWRARKGNPIEAWYVANSSGMARLEHWTVYWRGLDPSEIPGAIRDASQRPSDFAD